MTRFETNSATTTVEVDVWIDAPPPVVFGYFTDPEKYKQWMDSIAVINPVPGGEYQYIHPTGRTASGKFVDVVPPKRLVFTWGWQGSENIPPGSSRRRGQIHSENKGTRVFLVHTGICQNDLRQKHLEGWVQRLNHLEQLVAKGDMNNDE